ncbi:hypothetical protein [Gottfriedia solisilvae]|uniref:hypothetical protein n=1 Tax=Gottfriedia solisilvae TaxID=1516104 RepID=UPI003D2F3708
MRKITYILLVVIFLVSCKKDETLILIKEKKSILENYKMTKSEMNTLNMLGESREKLAIYKLKLDDYTDIQSLEAKIKVYSKGKLVHTIGGIAITILKDNDKTYYLTFKRQLQHETKNTYEWDIIFSNRNGHSMGQTLYKQPDQTNMSLFEQIEGKHEIVKGKEMALGAFVEGNDSMESVSILPDLKDNERLFKNKYVYLLCLEAK